MHFDIMLDTCVKCPQPNQYFEEDSESGCVACEFNNEFFDEEWKGDKKPRKLTKIFQIGQSHKTIEQK